MLGKKILIVEDNSVNLELMVDILEVEGYVLLQADNAEEGLVLAKTENPYLILMDIGMPGMDGLQATKLLKQDPITRSIPVVALTAHAMSGDKEKALAVGCDGYINKPIDTRTFPKMLYQFMR
jgi:CheY-like chemotaxis protein